MRTICNSETLTFLATFRNLATFLSNVATSSTTYHSSSQPRKILHKLATTTAVGEGQGSAGAAAGRGTTKAEGDGGKVTGGDGGEGRVGGQAQRETARGKGA